MNSSSEFYVFGKAAKPLISDIKITINKILFMRMKLTVYENLKLRFVKLHVLLYLFDRKLMQIGNSFFTAPRVHLKS